MHRSSLLRMKWFVDNWASKLPQREIKVLDVGSYDVNGSYRDLFQNDKFKYEGLDMSNGPNVDIVPSSPYDWGTIETDKYDVVISGQAFEHIEFFWITMTEMTRVMKQGGLLCLIAPNGFGEHRYPVDCYRFYTDGMIALARYVGLTPLHAHTNCAPSAAAEGWLSETCADSILIAEKPYGGAARHPDLKNYRCTPADLETLRGELSTCGQIKANRGRFRLIIKRIARCLNPVVNNT